MVMIVGLHYLNPEMGGALGQQSSPELNYYLTYLLESLFIVGVNCFILITGYFQIEKSSIKLTKVIELLLMMMFYGVVVYSIALLFGWTTFSWTGLITEIFPILVGLKWFLRTYIILYLLIPFINKGLNQMDKREYRMFLIILLVFFSLYPSFLPSPPVTDRGYGIINFVLLYSLGGYIKKYFKGVKTKSFYLVGYLLSALVTFCFTLGILDAIFISRNPWVAWGYNFIFNILGSVFLFLFFSKLSINFKIINYVAQFTLGVYFVHTSPLIYEFLYETVLNTNKFWHSPWFIIHALVSILLVYVVGTLIDMGRKFLFDRAGELITVYLKEKGAMLFKKIP